MLKLTTLMMKCTASPIKQQGFTPRFAQLDKKVLRYFGVFEELLDPAIVGSAPAGPKWL